MWKLTLTRTPDPIRPTMWGSFATAGRYRVLHLWNDAKIKQEVGQLFIALPIFLLHSVQQNKSMRAPCPAVPPLCIKRNDPPTETANVPTPRCPLCVVATVVRSNLIHRPTCICLAPTIAPFFRLPVLRLMFYASASYARRRLLCCIFMFLLCPVDPTSCANFRIFFA